jgi:uncharacterized protein YecT (DUF1311 family)
MRKHTGLLVSLVGAFLLDTRVVCADANEELFDRPQRVAEASKEISVCLISNRLDPQKCINLFAARCAEKYAFTTLSMKFCAGFELEVWQKRLADAIEQMRAIARPELMTNFDKIQASWNAWVGPSCNFSAFAQYWGGTGEPVIVISCLSAETARRAIAVEGIAAWWSEGHPPR